MELGPKKGRGALGRICSALFLLIFMATLLAAGFMAGTLYGGSASEGAEPSASAQRLALEQPSGTGRKGEVGAAGTAAAGAAVAGAAATGAAAAGAAVAGAAVAGALPSVPLQQKTAAASASKFAGKEGKQAPDVVCTNTCAKANNGVCDDGRAALEGQDPSHLQVSCDLGTDCADCGIWKPASLPPWGDGRGPIALLTTKGVEVRVKLTEERSKQQFSFRFAYTDPKKDVAVSREMHEGRVVEATITKIFYNIFKDRCVRPDGTRSLFVDVGSNFGWFTVLAGVMGCRVVAFEPVPHFRAFLEYNIALNGIGHLVNVQAHVVSSQHGAQLKMVVPSGGIWGTAGIDGTNLDSNEPGQTESFTVPSVTLDQAIREDVLLMKVDVEGWEWSVFKGAHAFLTSHKVENVIMEYSPGVAERTRNFDDLIATVQILSDLIQKGFRIAANLDTAGTDLKVPLPPFEEVTLHNVMYDLQDARLMQNFSMGCPWPEDLKPLWQSTPCNCIPEYLSPRSLHSTIGHNTNVWASINRTLQRLEGHVGMIKLHEPSATFFINNTHNVGMGHRDCKSMDPKYQVRHRCHCTDAAVCGEEEKLAAAAAAAGQIPANYVLPPP